MPFSAYEMQEYGCVMPEFSAVQKPTVLLSRRERKRRVPRCYDSRRSGLAKVRRAILPLPKGESGVKGKDRSKQQCACDCSCFNYPQALRSM